VTKFQYINQFYIITHSNINITNLTIDDYNKKLYDDIAMNIQIKIIIPEKTIFGKQCNHLQVVFSG
jgi:hypothetical protein